MCRSKGLTGGVLPMGMTLASAEIYEAFYSDERAKMFFHSSSFTGNAIACAAALANLEAGRSQTLILSLDIGPQRAISCSLEGPLLRG